MSDKKQIKERIKATEKTYQITSAMNMISTSKLKKCEKSLKDFRPVSDEIKHLVTSLIKSDPTLENKLLKPNKGKPCYIIVTSDRGLIGNYNNQVTKAFSEYVKEKHKSNDEFFVATIGFKAFTFAKKQGYQLLNKESINVRDEIFFTDFIEMSNLLIEGYKNDVIGKTKLFFTRFLNTMSFKVDKYNLLPIRTSNNDYLEFSSEYLFEPNKEVVLDSLVNIYVNYIIYRIMLEAKSSEHASRMNAMRNAKDNCLEIEQKLTLLYNHARQNQITTELIDVINGSNAVN